jgi:phage host-nuclease inhibitor protein Gam
VSLAGRFGFRHAFLAAFLVSLAGCGGMRGAEPRRVIEREETTGSVHVRLRSELDPARGTLGDRIVWHLSASLDAGARPETALVESPPPSLEMDASKAPVAKADRGRVLWSREYVLRAFDLGALALPRAILPIVVAGRADTLEFPRDTLFVDSLTQAAAGTIRPDRGPIETPLRTVDYIVCAVAALAVVVLAAFLIRAWLRARRRRLDAAIAPAPDPPEKTLEGALEALEVEVARLPRDVFYERLAQALRTYAASVTQAPALDLTTAELDRALARNPSATAKGREALISALRRADLAKFARFEDEVAEAKGILREARSVSGRLAVSPGGP